MVTIKPKLFRALSVTCLFALGACALSPQSVQVNPRVTVQDSLKESLDSKISVTVFDERLSRVIGYRGGVYESSAITTSDDLSLALRSAVEFGLRELGAEVVSAGDVPQFQLYLDELEYKVPEGSYVTRVSVKSRVRVVVQNGGQQFEGTYSADITERVPKAPSDSKNQELVDQVLSDVLNRLFEDTRFQAFMGQLK